jgi:hypothetical protein
MRLMSMACEIDRYRLYSPAQLVRLLCMGRRKMDDHWCVRLKDAYISLGNFIEANKTKEPYDEVPAAFLCAVAMLKKASVDELKAAMLGLVGGSSNLDGKSHKNVDLMAGFEANKGGFVIYDKDKDSNSAGPFMKSDFVIRLVCKRGEGEDARIVPSEIKTRATIDYLVAKYRTDPKKKAELVAAWFYMASCLADGVSSFILTHCLETVSPTTRAQIRNNIPAKCLAEKKLGNTPTMQNVFKLVNGLSNTPIGQSILGAVGVDPAKISHIVGATQDKLGSLDLEKIKLSVTNSAQNGEINGIGEILGSVFSTFSECIPVVDEGDIDEQD